MVYKCSVQTTSSGVVTDQDFHLCDLKKEPHCESPSGLLRFIPKKESLSFKGCPVQVDHFDLGMLESGEYQAGEHIILLTATNTKRLFHWSNESASQPSVCVDTEYNVPIFKDDGGFLISMETLTKERVSPSIVTSRSYMDTLKMNGTYNIETLQNQYNHYVEELKSSRISGGSRDKRATSTTTSSIQKIMLRMLDNNNQQSKQTFIMIPSSSPMWYLGK